MSLIEVQPITDVPAAVALLDLDDEAALRQLSVPRLVAYGLDYGDAIDLRSMVAAGTSWRHSCASLAKDIMDQVTTAQTAATRRNLQYRTSALLRMSQMMMLADDEERRSTYRDAARLFDEAGREDPGWVRMTIPTGTGDLAGWLLSPKEHAKPPLILVIGGVEGWAMDWESFGRTFADRGLATALIDGPGQGESRLQHRNFLTHEWRRSISCALDYLQSARGFMSIGVLGNSMGGTFAIHIASDSRILACCNNGGLLKPISVKARTRFYPKMEAFCSRGDAADEIWSDMEIKPDSLAFSCPFLIVHGGADPLVTLEESEQMFGWAAAADKTMRVISGGDHCIYNHPGDKNNLIGDWFASRLVSDTR